MKIGNYQLISIDTGTFALDGGSMFGIIPKPLWEKTNPADEKNRITMGARCLLLKSEDKIILIDTGMGTGWDEKFEKIYRVERKSSDLLSSLNQNGINPGDITDVMLTHLHFDHTGGSVYFEDGKALPTFPNATYHVQKKHFEWAKDASPKDRASFIKDRFLPLHNEGILNQNDGNLEFDDNISFLAVNGHTFSQQLVKVSDGNETLLYCGDFLPTSSHVPLPYIMGYDLQPLLTLHEKEELLPKAVEEQWHLFFEHDPYFTMGKVSKNEKGFFVSERFKEMI